MVYRRTPRSEQIREAARTRILDAATTLFSQQGYDATTMQDIVRKAKTSIGNAYFYFPNKNELMLEVAGTLTRATWDRSEAAAASVPAGTARLATIMYMNMSVALTARTSSLLIVTDQQHSAADAVRDVAVTRWPPVLAECLPELPAEDRKLAGMGIFSVGRAIIELHSAGPTDRSPRELIRYGIRWALRGLGVADTEITAALRVAARRSAGLLKTPSEIRNG